LCVALFGALLPSLAQAAETGKALHTIYLVRHGVYFDGGKPAEPNADKSLTPLGREQAEFTATRLASLPLKFDRIVTSEMVRARETGDIIAAKLGLTCERDAKLNESIPPSVDLATLGVSPIPGAEAQFEATWVRYFQPTPDAPRNDLLVCHGVLINWLASKALGVDTLHYTRMSMSNCALAKIVIRPDGTGRLQLLNDASHIPLEKQTTYMDVFVWPNLAPKNAK
jgi:serine/threonine-protein phosphatase PGAM5